MFGEKFRYALARLIAGPFGAVTVVVPDGEHVKGKYYNRGSNSRINQRGGVLEVPSGGTANFTNNLTGESVVVDDWQRPDTESSASVVIDGDEIIITPDRSTVLSPRGMQFTYHQEDESRLIGEVDINFILQ